MKDSTRGMVIAVGGALLCIGHWTPMPAGGLIELGAVIVFLASVGASAQTEGK